MTTAFPQRQSRAPLRRARQADIAGVCSGLSAHLGWSLLAVRSMFVALVLVSGAGLLLYAWLWMFVPLEESPPQTKATVRRRVPVAWMLSSVAVFFAVVTVFMLLDGTEALLWFTTALLAEGLAIAAALWAGLLDVRDPERGPRHVFTVRIGMTATLIVLFAALAMVVTRPSAGGAAFAGALLAVVAVAAVYAPILITKFRELTEDRVQRIREEQRSAMAAHLHDSVLQTLALIQNRAGASSEVARLARAQERELRGWLYDGDEPADSDLFTDLRDYAAALELDYPVHMDVVAAGASVERASSDIAAAAREAMLNAARHAGGNVSVYVENRPDVIEVYVRDRGPGFALADVPADRLGVRQSVIGRMKRAGGTAVVTTGAGGTGTEVRLRMERTSQGHHSSTANGEDETG